MVNRIGSQPICIAALLALIAVDNWRPAAGADPVVNAKSVADALSPAKRTGSKRASADNQSEQRALELVSNHLPDLGKLLQRLKSDNQRQYDLAIRDLAKSAKRLEYAKSRDEDLYEIEVEILKSQSSVKILAAKLKVRDSDSGRKQLRQSVRRQLNAEIAKADYTVRLLKERADKAQEQLSAAKKRMDSLKQESDVQLEKKYSVLLRNAGRLDPDGTKKTAKSKSNNAAKAKPAAAKKSNKE
jgi:hypothetical protein